MAGRVGEEEEEEEQMAREKSPEKGGHPMMQWGGGALLISEASHIMCVVVVQPGAHGVPADCSEPSERQTLFVSHLPLQISYSAKNEIFTNKKVFPLLLRMLPSENFQISGIIALLEMFSWKWVSAVGNGTKASQKSVQTLIAQANQRNICISYQSIMTANDFVSVSQLQRVIENIQRAQTNVIIILSDENVAEKFFGIVIELKITGKVWIAPESWVMSHLVASVPGIGATGTVLGLTIKPIKLDQFTWFVEQTLQCTPSNTTASPLHFGSQKLEELWGCSQVCDECRLLSPQSLADILNSSVWHWSFYSYAAVYTLAHTLHSFLGCHLETCQVKKMFEPWQVSFALPATGKADCKEKEGLAIERPGENSRPRRDLKQAE